MLFITHDLGIVRKIADRVCVMQRGKIVEQGLVERVFTAPEHSYTKALLAADGELPLQNVPDLLSNGYSTGIARCRNPFREDGGVCQKFFPCFTCPSMIVFEDDLWRLLSFYYRLLQERTKLSPLQWLKTYGPIIRRIDVDIIPHFPSEKVEEARSRAQRDPHPSWKGPVL